MMRILLPVLFISCISSFNTNAKAANTNQEKISYGMGVKAGEHYRHQGISIDLEHFVNGLNDAYNDKPLALDANEIEMLLVNFQKEQNKKIKAQEQQLAKQNLQASKDFLDKNKENTDVISLPSGLQYKILASNKSTINKPSLNDTVKVHYRGTLLDGTEFDSSYRRKRPAIFQIKSLIPGWQEALTLMTPGQKWQLFVPPELAYGPHGAGALIQPNMALIFEIELLDINPSTNHS